MVVGLVRTGCRCRASLTVILVTFTVGICSAEAADDKTAVPVTVVTAREAVMHRVINGIGTVEPLQSVIVRPRIEGQVVDIPFAEGQMVEKGSVLLKLDDRELLSNLVSAKAKKAQDEAQLRSAQMEADRYASLAEKGIASLSVLEQKNASNQQYTAAVQYDDAMIKNAETQLSFATILAPFTGRTGFKQVDIGSVVSTTSTNGIVTITQMDPIGVSFVAPGDRFSEIRDALKNGIADVELQTTDGARKLSTGKLTIMDNAVDSSNGSIHLRANFDNKTGALWPGLPVATRLTVEVRKGVVVPDKALARGRDGLYAFVVGGDHKVSKRSVKTAFVTDAMALITEGIDAGDQVVMDGQSRIADKVMVAATPWTGTPTGELSGEVSQ